VTNLFSSTVTPVDTAINTAGTPIEVGDHPEGVAITPDAKTAYVTNFFSNTVSPIDTATNAAGTPIEVDSGPLGIAITPDGRTAYVTNFGSAQVTPIDTATNTAGTPIEVGGGPRAIAITPDGKTAYVTSSFSNSVTPIDTATNTAGTAIPVGSLPIGIAITPDGRTAYVTNARSNSVTPIDTGTNTAGPAITVGEFPIAVAITPDGKTAYVVNSGSHTVTPIDTAANVPGMEIPVGSFPEGIAITPDGKTAYVTSTDSNSVTPVDTATNTAGTGIPVSAPTGIAVTPDQAPVAHLSGLVGTVGLQSGFDASASTVAFGTIASYAWNFGDGTTTTTTTPTTTHRYTSPGSYTASVTVTSSGGTSTTQVFTGQTVSRNGGPQATAAATFVVTQPTLRYFPLTPYRVLDTRIGQGSPQTGPLGPGQTLNVQVTGVPGPAGQVVPPGAAAVVMNVTVAEPTAPSFLTVWPQGAPQPTASNLNFVAGDIRPNLAQVALGSTGRVSIFNHFGTTQVIADVQGYFAPAPVEELAKGLFNPLTPARLFDTRNGTGAPQAKLGPGRSLDLQVTGRGGVPATGVEAVVLNVTVTNPTCPAPFSASCSFLTIWPTGAPRPVASNLNFGTGETVANRVIVPVNAAGKVSIFNHFGSTDVVADVGGWFTDGTDPAATGDYYTPINPTRILDTRNSTPVGSAQTINLSIPFRGATAAVANVTVTNTTEPSFLTVYPAGELRPLASDINWSAGQTIANLVETKLGAGGVWSIFNHFGSTDVIADVGGFYQPAQR
jgi:YVTN family beta-propeller protein